MHVLIQNCQTFGFLTAGLRWSEHEAKAVWFPGGVEACHFVYQKSIKAAQLVYRFGDQRLDFVSPISEECRDGMEKSP